MTAAASVRRLADDFGDVYSVAITPDGTRIITGSYGRSDRRRMLAEALQAEVDDYIAPASPTSATRSADGWWCATAATSLARS